MNKGKYINRLISDIIDDIEFDSDVIAIEKLLISLALIDFEKSINYWQYILEKYSITELMDDINFLPIIRNYPTFLINKMGLNDFFELMTNYSLKIKNLIYFYLFNIYEKDCILFNLLREFIKNEKIEKEEEFIKLIIQKEKEFPKEIFDLTEFLKKIILEHLTKKDIPLEFLITLTDIPKNNKEKALLKTLLIDYV